MKLTGSTLHRLACPLKENLYDIHVNLRDVLNLELKIYVSP